MKNKISFLLVGLLSLQLNAQQAKFKSITGYTNMAEKLASKYDKYNSPHESNSVVKTNTKSNNIIDQSQAKPGALPSATWTAIGGSENIYGVLSSQNRPLNYNEKLNAISFIHRKGSTYTALPVSNTGAMIARISTSWGQSWDSTCFWSNGSNLARYPQGGIYNPPGNLQMSNAYIVGMGPITDGTAWTGNWYASKQLGMGNYDNTASAAPGAQQFIANTPPFAPGLAKHDFPRPSFSATDDGIVRTIANRYYGYDGGAGAPTDFRGAAIVKGTFNAGTFVWTSDTIIPDFVTRTNQTKQAWDQPVMAWNQSGTHGYVVFLGAAATATGSNKGWQPIIYKTTNSGASWALIPGIDFNAPAFAPVKQSIAAVNVNPTLEVPFFKVDEGYDVSVDVNNKLHIFSTLVGTASQHNDSLEYTYNFGADGYNWPHTPGARPYLYDFIGDGTSTWTFTLVDSMATEVPGSVPAAGGYTDNPWDIDQNSKVSSDARLQLSRTSDGNYIVYSWAESDTNFTNGQKKYNTQPNIKARAMVTGTINSLSPTEVNVTKPTPPGPGFSANPNVANRAMFHFQSPTCLYVNCLGSNTVQLRVPYTVSNSNPYSQLTENRHWFSAVTMEFAGLTICTGFQHNLSHEVSNMDLYPNPSNGNTLLTLDLPKDEKIQIEVLNIIGQIMYSKEILAHSGANTYELQLSDLKSGLYLVQVNTGKSVSTKKLIIQ
ncbi:MAG: T9SS type A sorting domain-containing protein [Sphingobacteriaceae bacterium]|nr:T9SS type A sorting domain-containing protein [Sphingobacteriaceae bacterium]